MGRKVPGLLVVVSQLLIVGFFFTTIYNEDVTVERYVSTIHNENLNKIAKSVSLLFKEEKISVKEEYDDLILEEL